jgi:hypothetical protein
LITEDPVNDHRTHKSGQAMRIRGASTQSRFRQREIATDLPGIKNFFLPRKQGLQCHFSVQNHPHDSEKTLAGINSIGLGQAGGKIAQSVMNKN